MDSRAVRKIGQVQPARFRQASRSASAPRPLPPGPAATRDLSSVFPPDAERVDPVGPTELEAAAVRPLDPSAAPAAHAAQGPRGVETGGARSTGLNGTLASLRPGDRVCLQVNASANEAAADFDPLQDDALAVRRNGNGTVTVRCAPADTATDLAGTGTGPEASAARDDGNAAHVLNCDYTFGDLDEAARATCLMLAQQLRSAGLQGEPRSAAESVEATGAAQAMEGLNGMRELDRHLSAVNVELSQTETGEPAGPMGALALAAWNGAAPVQLSARIEFNKGRPMSVAVRASMSMTAMGYGAGTPGLNRLPITADRAGSARATVEFERRVVLPPIAAGSQLQESIRSALDIAARLLQGGDAVKHSITVRATTENPAVPGRDHDVHVCISRMNVSTLDFARTAMEMLAAQPTGDVSPGLLTPERGEQLWVTRNSYATESRNLEEGGLQGTAESVQIAGNVLRAVQQCTEVTDVALNGDKMIYENVVSPTDALVGRNLSDFRHDAGRLIARTPEHPLSFLLDPSGSLLSVPRAVDLEGEQRYAAAVVALQADPAHPLNSLLMDEHAGYRPWSRLSAADKATMARLHAEVSRTPAPAASAQHGPVDRLFVPSDDDRLQVFGGNSARVLAEAPCAVDGGRVVAGPAHNQYLALQMVAEGRTRDFAASGQTQAGAQAGRDADAAAAVDAQAMQARSLVSIGGVAVTLDTAHNWVADNLLDHKVLDNAPKVLQPGGWD